MVSCGPFTRPRHVVVNDVPGAIAEAQRMIEEKRLDPSKYDGWIDPQDLPPALRISRLCYASVHLDHLDLVLARNPDWSIGGRIWAKSHRPHHDESTKYPGIHFYRYNNDNPESPDNIP
jgi:hypothetical protein